MSKKKNVFCKVEFLDGKALTFQFPNDLRSAMLDSHHKKELKPILSNALINVPVSLYGKNGKVTLRLAKIKSIYVAPKKISWRTRGQFLTEEVWKNNLSLSQVKFLWHDHSFLNKIRLTIDLIRWKMRSKKKA